MDHRDADYLRSALKGRSSIGAHPDAPPQEANLLRCYRQPSPPRRLPHLQGIRIAIVIADASLLTDRDHCVSSYLGQAGVPNDFIQLGGFDIHGNGHMMMLEKNSDQIASLLEQWLKKHGL